MPIERLELAGRVHLIDCVVHGRDSGKRAFDGDGMRRQSDAAPIGELLELGGDRRRVNDDGLLPLVQTMARTK